MIHSHSYEKGSVKTTEGLVPSPPPTGPQKVWVEVESPTKEELAALQEGYGLHDLALVDAMREGHPPKIEEFESHTFLIVHGPTRGELAATRKLSIFISKTWIISVSRLSLADLGVDLGAVRRDLRRMLHAPALVLYRLLEVEVAGFQHTIEAVTEQLEDLEEQVQDGDDEPMEKMLDLRTDLRHLARVVRSQRDVYQSLARVGHAAIPAKATPYLRDAYDHMVRVCDLMDASRDALLAVREAHHSAINVRLSETMRVLTVIATIMMPLSLIAGVYGMNVSAIPGAGTPASFWYIVSGMTLIAILMLVYFRRRNWV